MNGRLKLGKRRATPIALTVSILLMGMAASAGAGGIAGIIRDAGTGAPLEGIDLDLYDSTWTAVVGVNATSGADGSYLFSPIDAGEYYLRADPNVDQSFVDSYHPDVFLKSEALTFTVNTFGTTIVDFNLDAGVVIAGSIVNSVGTPLELIDLDVYAWDKSYISSINAKTDADGAYVLGCFPPGTFYVKADPSPSDFVVDVFFDSKGTLAQADAVIVNSINVEGVDFVLPAGGNISGTLRAEGSGTPLAGVDIDIFDSLGNFISSESATTDALGFYELGSLPPGVYFVHADASLPQLYVDTYYGDTFDASLATPVTVSAGSLSSLIDINLPLGGTLSGTLFSEGSGSPLSGVDIDVFDSATGNFLISENAASDLNGYFQIGALPAGQYLIQADAVPAQMHVDTYYGDIFDQNLALPVSVSVGTDTPGIDIHLPSGGTLSGTVTHAADGMPLAGVHLSVFDAITGGILVGAGGDTDAAGAFTAGAVPPGDYLLRSNGVPELNLAFEFYPGITFKSEAGVIPVSMNLDSPGHQFALDMGGWISGSVLAATGGAPISGIDIDAYGITGEWVGALDIESDIFGNYLLGPAPVETFLFKADPPLGSEYYFQYFDHTFNFSQALPIAVSAGGTHAGVDFDLFMVNEVDADSPAARVGLSAAYPNPFNPQTTIPFKMAEDGAAQLRVFDLKGRQVRLLASGSFAAGDHPVEWNGRDDRGQELPSGIYFVEFRTGELRQSEKLVLLR